jgi:hypothetical protein
MWGEGREKRRTAQEEIRFYTIPVNVIDLTSLSEMSPNSGVLLENICSMSALLQTTNFKANISCCGYVLIVSKTLFYPLQTQRIWLRKCYVGNYLGDSFVWLWSANREFFNC